MTAPKAMLDADLHILATSTTEELELALERALESVKWPDDVPLPEDLTPNQRRVAEILATRRGIPTLASVAMPYQVQFRRRWLGIDPPGALERRHTFTRRGRTVSWPLWRIWRSVGDAPARQKGISAVVADVVDLLDAYVDVVLWSPYGDLDTSQIEQRIARLGADARAGEWAARRLDEALSWSVRESIGGTTRWIQVEVADFSFGTTEPGSLDAEGSVQLALFVALARAGRAVEPAWERWFPLFDHAFLGEIVAALPEDRRESILLASADRGLPRDGLFAFLTLWPKFPYPGLARWIDELLARPANTIGVDASSLRTWREEWKRLRSGALPPPDVSPPPASASERRASPSGGKERAKRKPKTT
jgi:hypothetical protein